MKLTPEQQEQHDKWGFEFYESPGTGSIQRVSKERLRTYNQQRHSILTYH